MYRGVSQTIMEEARRMMPWFDSSLQCYELPPVVGVASPGIIRHNEVNNTAYVIGRQACDDDYDFTYDRRTGIVRSTTRTIPSEHVGYGANISQDVERRFVHEVNRYILSNGFDVASQDVTVRRANEQDTSLESLLEDV